MTLVYFFNCQEAQRLRIFGKNWLHMNEEIAFKKTVRCTKTTDLINLGIFYIRLNARSSTTRYNYEEKTRLS